MTQEKTTMTSACSVSGEKYWELGSQWFSSGSHFQCKLSRSHLTTWIHLQWNQWTLSRPRTWWTDLAWQGDWSHPWWAYPIRPHRQAGNSSKPRWAETPTTGKLALPTRHCSSFEHFSSLANGAECGETSDSRWLTKRRNSENKNLEVLLMFSGTNQYFALDQATSSYTWLAVSVSWLHSLSTRI